MRQHRVSDHACLHQRLCKIQSWLQDSRYDSPVAEEIADLVRLTTRMIADQAPGKTVELRIPPFVAVQCIQGPTHRRGTPPNVVETDPYTWLQLVTGYVSLEQMITTGMVHASGSRVLQLDTLLPLVVINDQKLS